MLFIVVAMREVFDSWMTAYGKQYETSTEYDQRLEIFAENAEIVSKHNSEDHSYTSMSSCPSINSKDFVRL